MLWRNNKAWKEKQKRGRGLQLQIIREGLTEKVVYEQRPEELKKKKKRVSFTEIP